MTTAKAVTYNATAAVGLQNTVRGHFLRQWDILSLAGIDLRLQRLLRRPSMLSPQYSLERLREGNQRYVTGTRIHGSGLDHSRRHELVSAQTPFAVILGCADSRVPPEIVFDQGLGDLFVIRVAGNVAQPFEIGSAEYAVARLNTKLIVVLGHSGCGAVKAALSTLQGRANGLSPSLDSLVKKIEPAVSGLLADAANRSPEELLSLAVRANVRNSMQQLQADSELLSQRVQDGTLAIVGAEYSLATGAVGFLSDVPSTPT